MTLKQLDFPAWKLAVDESAKQAAEEIRAMAEHARRSIGQRTRRNQEMLGLVRANAISRAKRCG